MRNHHSTHTSDEQVIKGRDLGSELNDILSKIGSVGNISYLWLVHWICQFHQTSSWMQVHCLCSRLTWVNEAICCHRTCRTWSILIQVMAWCLTATSHYLNQCWLITVRASGIHLNTILQEMLKVSILDMSLKITNSKLQPHPPRTEFPALGQKRVTGCTLIQAIMTFWLTCISNRMAADFKQWSIVSCEVYCG